MPIISLGRNCEVAYAMNQHDIATESSLLNWAFVPSDDALFQSVLHPLSVFSGGYTQVNANMFRCDLTNIAFHAKERFENWKDLSRDDPGLLSAVSELKSRTNHLALKLQSQLSGPEAVDAFLKPPYRIRDGVDIFCKDLRSLIDDAYPGNNVRLWIVTEGKCPQINCVDELRNVHVASVSEYANDATSNRFSDQARKDWRALFTFVEAHK